MLKQKITVLVLTTVAGPSGWKLKPGTVAELDDNEYTRLLLKSETVTLVDPPSLDLEFLEKGGYELQEGYSYDDLRPPAAVVKEEPKKVGKKARVQKKVEPVPAPPLEALEPMDSEEQVSNEPVPEESSQEAQEPVVKEEEETP